MTNTPLKQQLLNYSTLLVQLFTDYYKWQKKGFWLVQLFMVISTLSGFFWMLAIILGVSHDQNPENTADFKYQALSWLFEMPLWQWLSIASIAGVVSAWSLYISIQIGVKSVLSFQEELSKRCLRTACDIKNASWTTEFSQLPRQVLLRILRQGVQLSGLVSRRITRTFVPLITFILSFIVLLYLDGKLLLLIFPLAITYIVALYFINRYAARVSTEAADILPKASKRFSRLVGDILNHSLEMNSDEFESKYQDSLFMHQADLKYQRRLAEIHVGWLNTLFLVLGIATIILYIVYLQATGPINWQGLLIFLVALKYAGSSLQQIASMTVAFSRFLPEIQLVYRLLNSENNSDEYTKTELFGNAFVYIPSSCMDSFELNQLNKVFVFSSEAQIVTLTQVREGGVVNFFKHLPDTSMDMIVVDNNINRLKTLIKNRQQFIASSFSHYVVFSHLSNASQNLNLHEFLAHQENEDCGELEDEIDAYE